MKKVKNNRGQSTIEMTLLFTIVVAALIAGQYYIKHAMEGRLKDSSNQIGSQFSFDDGNSNKTTSSSSSTTEVTTAQGVTSNNIGSQTQNQTVNETISKGTSLFGN